MKAALLGDPIAGIHNHDHGDPEGVVPDEISGAVDSASPNVRFDGVPVARVGDTTAESCCCGGGAGALINGSSKVRANGMSIAYAMADTQTHGDTCALSGGGSTTVNIA